MVTALQWVYTDAREGQYYLIQGPMLRQRSDFGKVADVIEPARATVSSMHDSDPNERRWHIFQQLSALGVAVVIGADLIVTRQFAFGYLAAFALAPVWWPVIRGIAAARVTFALGLLAVANGWLLLAMNAGNRPVDAGQPMQVTLELLGVLACAATMVWVIRIIGVGPAGVGFAAGMLLGANPASAFNALDPLRFAFAMPLTLLLLFGAVTVARNRAELLSLAVAAGFSIIVGARSVFGAELLALVVLGLWSRRILRSARLSMAGTVAALGALAWAAYSFAQALLLEGLLGEAARVRTEHQIRASGELILGGRPEISATLALMRDSIWGYGAGVRPIFRDVAVARDAMWEIGYDPMNGYVDNYMFGTVFRLHSMIGDMWATFGIFGVLFIGYLVWQALRVIQRGPRPRMGNSAALFLAMMLLWNAFFSPWYSSIELVIIFLGLSWARLDDRPPDGRARMATARRSVFVGKEKSWT